MLKTPFLKNRHLQAGHRANATRHDLAFERIQFLMIPLRQFDKRNPLGHFDDVRNREGAEA